MGNIFIISEDTNINIFKDKVILTSKDKAEEKPLKEIKNIFLLRKRNIPQKFVRKFLENDINLYKINPKGELEFEKLHEKDLKDYFNDELFYCFLLTISTDIRKFLLNIYKSDKILSLDKNLLAKGSKYTKLATIRSLDVNDVFLIYKNLNFFTKKYIKHKFNQKVPLEYYIAKNFAGSLVRAYIISFLAKRGINPYQKLNRQGYKTIDLIFLGVNSRIDIYVADIFVKYLISLDFDENYIRYLGRLIIAKLISGKFFYGERFNKKLHETVNKLRLVQEKKLDCLGLP
jgi:hypothetical protein